MLHPQSPGRQTFDLSLLVLRLARVSFPSLRRNPVTLRSWCVKDLGKG
jgi:hypothetical protein